jgi:THUMP domain-like
LFLEPQGGVSEGTLSFLMTETCSIWQWLASDEGESAIGAMPMAPTTAQIAAMRNRMSAEQVRAASNAMRARVKGAKKLDHAFATRLISDIPGVEMASSAIASLYKAQRFATVLGDSARIADLCCGIGGDSWGLGRAGLVPIGVDSNADRAWVYQHNTGFDAICGDALNDCPIDIAGFHLDPARRNIAGKRTLDIEDFEPGPKVWDRLIETHPNGAIKLNPGVNAYDLPMGELEILSEPGGLTQALLWVGSLAGEHERRATKLGADGSVSSIAGEAWRPEDSNEIGDYLGTLDPCLERADLVGAFLDQAGVSLVHPGTGMVTASEPVSHPMMRWYRVIEVMGWNRKRVKAVLRGLDAGVIEVRTRGGAVNPDSEQRYLRGNGDNPRLSVLIYRIDRRILAITAERVDPEAIVPSGDLGAGR